MVVYAEVRRFRGEDEGCQRAEGGREGVRRDLPRQRSRPRGRGDRLAPEGGPGAGCGGEAVLPRHLQRDHQAGRSQGRRGAARHRHAARGRAAGAPHPRPAGGLQGLAAPVEVHPVREQPFAECGPRAVRRAAPPRGAPARNRRVHARGLLPDGRRGEEARCGRVLRREAVPFRRQEAGDPREAGGGQHPPGPGGRVSGGDGPQGATEDAACASAVHHVHVAAGGVERARLFAGQDDEARAVAVRAGVHHVHANGLGERVRPRAGCGEGLHRRRLRRGLLSGEAERLQVEGRRAGRARGDPSDGRGPYPRYGRAGRRGAEALRPHLAPVPRQPDGGCEDDGQDGVARGPQAGAGARLSFHRERDGDRLRGLPQGDEALAQEEEGGRGRGGRRFRRGRRAAEAVRRRGAGRGPLAGGREEDEGPDPLLRGVAHQGARGERCRPSVDLRRDDRDAQAARVREDGEEEACSARARHPRLRLAREEARFALQRRLHGRDGGRARQGRGEGRADERDAQRLLREVPEGARELCRARARP